MRFYNTSGKIISEGISTRNAESYGWDLGIKERLFGEKPSIFSLNHFYLN